ncbi:ABC transporter permease [Halobacteria archaeon AArc-curdl1]|uniref:ABC transporter permease n=1 Tax=Natronosalvus hydrolyticus TaxID=2979988 RepID=A0AAP2Z651_9EURY|nr:ABC transporter permease [Halobacteria archaeon AArc-curdl1]
MSRVTAIRRFGLYALWRLVWAIVVVFSIVSGLFVLFVIAPDDTDAPMLWAAAISGDEVEFGDPPPLSEQYIEWIVSVFSLEWGESMTAATWINGSENGAMSASNASAVAEAIPVTLAYVVPSTIFAFILAAVVGYYAAQTSRSWVERLSSGSTYLLFSLPNFFLAAVIFYTLRDLDPSWFPDSYATASGFLEHALWLSLPAFVLSTHVLAGHYRYSRTETRAALNERYVTLVRSKGAGQLRIARHVFRVAAVPLVTVFVTELLAVILVAIFVLEVVFSVPGIGLLAYEAVLERELELVMILTAVFATAAVLANVVQDLATIVLDPRAHR